MPGAQQVRCGGRSAEQGGERTSAAARRIIEWRGPQAREHAMSDVPSDWIKAAVAITPSFETTGDPYMGVTGDFDEMGISCGALQWNIGMSSLQPMVKNVGQPVVKQAMPKFGDDLWTACNSPVAAGLKIVRGWQTNKKLRPDAEAELRAFMGTPQMRAQQDSKIGVKAETAFKMASEWAAQIPGGKSSKRSFCWFFDIVTQNGNLKGLTFQDVANFLEQNKPDKSDDFVCDFLASRTGSSGHVKDAHENARLWRNKAEGVKLELLVLSYLRAQLAKSEFSHVVLNRKGTIAMGAGHVNGRLRTFAELDS
jgi:hypothetical protein